MTLLILLILPLILMIATLNIIVYNNDNMMIFAFFGIKLNYMDLRVNL